MYLHIGKGNVIRKKDVIAIFDLDITSQSYITRNYLRAAEQGGSVINASEDIPKSFIVCSENGVRKVYLSQMATATLLHRAETEKII